MRDDFVRPKRPPEPGFVMDISDKMRKFGGTTQSTATTYVRGNWSQEEDRRLKEAVESFLRTKEVSVEEYKHSLSSENRTQERSQTKQIKGIWIYCSNFFPHRTVESVKNRGERIFHPSHKRGRWSDQEVSNLVEFVSEYGRSWVKIGSLLNRDPNSVRDKYRLETEKKSGLGKPTSSRWTKDEEQHLVTLVKEYTNWKPGDKVPLYNIPWATIAKVVQRTKSACMEKWHSNLHGKTAGYRTKNWATPQFEELVHAVRNCGAKEYDQVPWESLPLEYSTTLCRRNWKNLIKKRKLTGLPFTEQVRELCHHYPVNQDFTSKQVLSEAQPLMHESLVANHEKTHELAESVLPEHPQLDRATNSDDDSMYKVPITITKKRSRHRKDGSHKKRKKEKRRK